MGLVVLSFVFMIIEKSGYNKAERDLESAKEEYNANKAELNDRKKEDDMRMMLMGIMGANAGGNGGAQAAGIDMGAIRGMIDDAMSRNVQQLPPVQQSGANDETIQKLNDTIARLQEQISANAMVAATVAPSNNDDIINSLVEGQKMIIQRLAEQQPVEKVIAREVAVANANDETIRQILRNQEILMEKVAELSAKQNAEPQVVEKIVEKEVKVEVPVEVEKIVEKEVVKEVPVEVEKIIEKEVLVEIPVEKIVEKEVRVEVPVEKVVSATIPVAVPTPNKPKKEVAARLTIDEAYALLSKQQQKYFDALRQYALTKDKCKEKKSTYFIVFGQSSVNPLMKLTIKKDTVVALFKMEDEYLKDIKRDATSDGTKVKVKETEVIISDAQACKVAKNMIDLREDQIERYQDLLKEQRTMKRK